MNTAMKTQSKLLAYYCHSLNERGERLRAQMIYDQEIRKMMRAICRKESEIDDLESEIDDLESEIDDLESEIDDLETRIDDLEGEINNLQVSEGNDAFSPNPALNVNFIDPETIQGYDRIQAAFRIAELLPLRALERLQKSAEEKRFTFTLGG